jgi:hypothetical protein
MLVFRRLVPYTAGHEIVELFRHLHTRYRKNSFIATLCLRD